MQIYIGDTLKMKKKHPCGAAQMLVLRAGMDFRLRCTGCGREFMISRRKLEPHIRQVISGNRAEDDAL